MTTCTQSSELMPSNKDAAIALVSLGLRIFQCSADKTPMVAAWEQAATSSPFAVNLKWEATPDALPAIPVGAHGLIVIDCDRKPKGPDGVAAFHALCEEQSINLSNAFVVETPSGGLHFYFTAQTPYGNSRGSLPDGIDVRGVGGYVIAPGATLSEGRSYSHAAGSWDAIPPLPDALASFLKRKGAPETPSLPIGAAKTPTASERERHYAENALHDEIEKLATTREGQGRNVALNNAALHLGEMVGAWWIERDAVEQALWDAAEQNGYRSQDGNEAAWKTLQSGLESGIANPRTPLPIIEIPQWLRDSVANWIAAYKAKHSHTATQPSGKRSVTLIQGSEIQERPMGWLWDQYLPLGKLTLLAGAGGTGKSTIAFNLAGTITSAGAWPDGTQCTVAGNVLIWSSEDDPADTIKPRLMAAGADERRYGVIAGTVDEHGLRCPFDAARDMDNLREAVSRIGGISLLIIDPIVTAVTGDMHKANDVRRSLQAIVDFAAETNCAVLGITHFAKGTAGKNSAERVIGSQAFAALARMVLVAAKEEESNRRVFTRAKSNNSADTGGFSYSIEVIALHHGITATRVAWGESLHGSSRAILAEVEGDEKQEGDKMRAAKQFLLETLANGPGPSKEVTKHAREGYGISEDTLRRAYKEIGVKPYRVGFGSNGTWMWALL